MADRDIGWEEICSRVRELREERGASLEACANRLGLKSHAQYFRREKGQPRFTIAELRSLREFFDAPYPWPFVTLREAKAWEASQRGGDAQIHQLRAEVAGMAGTIAEMRRALETRPNPPPAPQAPRPGGHGARKGNR